MAKLLISFPQQTNLQADADPNQPPDQLNSISYKVALDENVLAEIKQNFEGIPEVIPVLSLGNSQSGRASTLEVFLDEGNEGSFSSEDKPQGVYVWTRPVSLNNTSLLLVKIWGVNFTSEQNKELEAINKKVMIALMSICSICLFCGEKTTMFQSMTVIYDLHKEIKDHLSLEVSRYFVFVDKEATLKHKNFSGQFDAFKAGEYASASEVLYRGSDGMSDKCKERLLQIVGDVQTHKPFLTSHSRVMEATQTPDMISALAIILEQILNVAELDLDFHNFISSIPNFTDPRYQEGMRHIEVKKKISNSFLSAAALEFFDESTKESTSHKISNSLLNTLLEQYDPGKPIIVMVIIGNQGMGKSTLLNHIVKFYLGSTKLKDFFKTGNTQEHTTKASQVLSSPLKLGENQLVLVDLEGLDGIETQNERDRILQENLVSAILTVASVPCILIRNEVQSIDFVERISSRLSILKSAFGYKLERVHLLFHDRDLSADTNADIENHIKQMNRQYFANETVLKLRNKPNFNDASKVKMCEELLKELNGDSDFPKKNQSGSPVLLKQLITEMTYITEYNSSDVSEIRLNDRETQEFNEFLKLKFPLLRNIFENVKGNDTNGSLESNFNEQCRQFMAECITEMNNLSVKWSIRARTTIDIEIVSYRAEIVGIEYCYQSIKDITVNESSKKLVEQLDFLYKKSWWVWSFNKSAAKLKKTLLNVKERYPSSAQNMDQILLKFEEKRNNLENWYYVNYGFQVATTVASGGLGLAAKGAVTAVTAARMGYAAVVGTTAVAARIGYGTASTNLALNEPAIELFYINKPRLLWFMKTSTTLNSEAIRILEEVNPPSDQPRNAEDSRQHPVQSVLLVIAAKELGATFLLNEFIHFAAPFTPSSIVSFNSSKFTQILTFIDKNRKVSIINLGMKKNIAKEKFQIIEKIAISLIPKVSLTCIMLDPPSYYAYNIIAKAFPPPKFSEAKSSEPKISEPKISEDVSYNPRFNPRVAAIYPRNREDSALGAKLSELERRGVYCTRIRVRDFSNESLIGVVPDVKNEFDISTPVESRKLLEALRDAERDANS